MNIVIETRGIEHSQVLMPKISMSVQFQSHSRFDGLKAYGFGTEKHM